MEYKDALQELLRGKLITRGGRIFRKGRGVEDVTDPNDRVQLYKFSEEEREASDWEIADPNALVAEPEVVPPETVDEVLAEEHHTE